MVCGEDNTASLQMLYEGEDVYTSPSLPITPEKWYWFGLVVDKGQLKAYSTHDYINNTERYLL